MNRPDNIAIIATVAKNGVIGKQGVPPWHIQEDIEHFLKKTEHASIVVGRRTFEALSREHRSKISHRRIIIMSRHEDYKVHGKLTAHNWPAVVDYARTTEQNVFVIGGQSLFKLALPVASNVYLTRVDQDAEGDAQFPPWNPEGWKRVENDDCKCKQDCGVKFSFETWQRGNAAQV